MCRQIFYRLVGAYGLGFDPHHSACAVTRIGVATIY